MILYLKKRKNNLMKEIELTHEKVALVDDKDFCLINQFKWHVHDITARVFYARTKFNGRIVSMHNLVLQPKTGYNLDISNISKDKLSLLLELGFVVESLIPHHRNGNGLDNQRHNLKLVTYSENVREGKQYKQFSSLVKGVSYINISNRWQATIGIKNKNYSLGTFKTEEEAIAARTAGEIIYWRSTQC